MGLNKLASPSLRVNVSYFSVSPNILSVQLLWRTECHFSTSFYSSFMKRIWKTVSNYASLFSWTPKLITLPSKSEDLVWKSGLFFVMKTKFVYALGSVLRNEERLDWCSIKLLSFLCLIWSMTSGLEILGVHFGRNFLIFSLLY